MKQLLVRLINGKSFKVNTKDFAKRQDSTVIKRQLGRNITLANSYIISAEPCQ